MPDFDFSTLITDRSEADVRRLRELADRITGNTDTAAERAAFETALKGAYGCEDMNRVGEAVTALAKILEGYGYGVSVDPETDVSESDTPSPAQLAAYLSNVRSIRNALGVPPTTPALPEDMTLDTDGANAIEQNLRDVHTLVGNMATVFPLCGISLCGVRNLAAHTVQSAKINVSVPVSTALVYTGSAQTFTFTGAPDSAIATQSGDTSGTDAGQYQTRWTLVDPTLYQWADGTPGAEKTVVTTIAKAIPVVTAPSPKALDYTGSAQELVTAGVTTGGTMQYSLDAGTWSTGIPTGTAAGIYTVYYRVVGGANYEDAAAERIVVAISKATPTVTAPTATNPTYSGSAQALITAGTTTGGTLQYALDKATPFVTAPVPTNPTYNGLAQELVTAGYTTGGTLQYALES